MSDATQILLCSDSARRRRSWSEALDSLPCRVWSEADLPAGAAAADLVITDRPLAADRQRESGSRQAAALREVGVIAIGVDVPADVSLPSDVTARELRLACLLLGQIVRLRRERREDQRSQEVLSQQAFSDPLTGLPNRRAYDLEMDRRIRGLGRGQRQLCLVLIDLDHFKSVNDQLGHAQGDSVLAQAGRALVDSVRSDDFVARLGGDEFAVLVSNLAAADARSAVERLRASLVQLMDGQLTASAGFAVLARPAAPEALYQAADAALLKAKSEGRNRSVESQVDDDSRRPATE